jgi:hypothetical protein
MGQVDNLAVCSRRGEEGGLIERQKASWKIHGRKVKESSRKFSRM